MKVRTRIAPSPTGFAHVGNAYTALFNYAFARKNNGEFVVRVEDTDRKRHVEAAEKAIYDGLAWVGLSWDEGADIGGKYAPYRQSERLSLYRDKADWLVLKGLAYEDEGAIRFRNQEADVSWDDLVRGEITFPGSEVTDFVIMKSDGFPTYNFAVVIDDIEMKITHVIRGEEHISNTPRQIALYRAFEVDHPYFAHLPTLRNSEHKKLSKRRDPVDLRLYQEKGYLPEALDNFLCLMGWSHPEGKEIYSLEEFIRLLDLKDVRHAGPIFDTNKLDWMNGEYIRNTDIKDLEKMVYEFYSGKFDKKLIAKVLPLVQTRIKLLSEFGNMCEFFTKKPKVDMKLFGKDYKKHLEVAKNALESVTEWDKEGIDKVLIEAVEKNNFSTGKFFMDLRIAVTGQKITPPINDSIAILKKDTVISRISKFT